MAYKDSKVIVHRTCLDFSSFVGSIKLRLGYISFLQESAFLTHIEVVEVLSSDFKTNLCFVFWSKRI